MAQLFKDSMRQRPLSPDDEYNTEEKKEKEREPWDKEKGVKDDIPF